MNELPPPRPGQSWVPSPATLTWYYYIGPRIYSGILASREEMTRLMRDDWNEYNPNKIK